MQTSMKPVFNEKKATQVAASFIQLSGGQLNYMKLIKLMYLADRSALLSWGRPITYDSYFSLKHGPILSSTFDLISEGERPSSNHFWFEYVSAPEGYTVKLKQECSPEDLSQAEEQIILSIFQEYGGYDKWKLVDHLHQVLKEWKNPCGSAIPISYRDILEAGGKSPEEIQEIEQELASIAIEGKLLGCF
jgi:uncharacterized phage-associated protein